MVAANKPQYGITAVVQTLPPCAVCGRAARYDAATLAGPWAYLCENHYLSHRRWRVLGVGKGQALVTRYEADQAAAMDANRGE